MIKIVTNNIPRPLLTWGELTNRERTDEYGLMGNRARGEFYVRFRGCVYPLVDFDRASKVDFPGWDGVYPEDYWMGVLVRLIPDDPDRVVMGRYYSFQGGE